MEVNRKKLEKLMVKHLLNNEELAQKAGVNVNTISRIRNGSGARTSTIKKICEALSCTPDDLI